MVRESGAPKTILLLEDNPDDEQLALRAFRSCAQPLVVEVARDGAEGLDLLGLGSDESAKIKPDLIVSDLKMPKVNGDEVLRQARADARLHGVPFVIFSSSDEEDDTQRCFNLGATAYCVKPVDFLQYIDCAKGLVEHWLPASLEGPTPGCAIDRASVI